MTEWGEAISVDGKRPGWLRDGEKIEWAKERNEGWRGPCAAEGHNWEGTRAYPTPTSHIRLPATHPYYTVQRYNAKHGTSFVYWPGGDAAPEDWSGGKNSAIDADGRVVWPDADSPNWGRIDKDTPYRGRLNIVGYLRRAKPETATYDPETHVAVKRMTEAEARVAAVDTFLCFVDAPIASAYVQALKDFGIIKPEPTEAERIATKTGLDLATVTAVLDAREGSDDDD